MCIAIPGKLLEKADNRGIVQIRGYRMPVELGIVAEVQPGDYVLVHAGCAIARLSKAEAEEINELFDTLEQYDAGN
ncbi:MAG: HypC/HybG/HupF family hydrogenase formation chaperone [Bacillota bacterium]